MPAWGEYPGPGSASGQSPVQATTAVAALTENSGSVGGTNDGDLPDIGTVSASPTQAEVTAIRDSVRECAAKINAIVSALDAAGLW